MPDVGDLGFDIKLRQGYRRRTFIHLSVTGSTKFGLSSMQLCHSDGESQVVPQSQHRHR